MSSASSASISPAPGPATIRLALVRVGIELLGWDQTRDVLFPRIRSMRVRVRPPEQVAFSYHVLHAYKVEEGRGEMGESVIYREMAHAQGPMTIYIEIPASECPLWTTLLMAIGYWGQASSFTSCLQVRQDIPHDLECALPLQDVREETRVRPLYSGVLTEFREDDVSWDEVVGISSSQVQNPLKVDVYVWPLTCVMHHQGGKLFRRLVLP